MSWVEEVFVRWGRIVEITVGGKTIGTTPRHPHYVLNKRSFVPALALEPGDIFRSDDGQWVRCEGVRDTGRYEQVFNLRVAGGHTYFLSGRDWGFSVWAHNTCEGEAELGELASYSKGGFSIKSLKDLIGQEIHHIATKYGKIGTQLSELFESAGLSLESAWNRMRLNNHVGPHGDKYNNYVFKYLSDAVQGLEGSARTQALMNALKDLRRQIRSGDMPLAWLLGAAGPG